ncbi:hypothetical protein ABEB36_011526 [Hypothenemus hampei]|uniref:KASH domain-containing protein n=1 Tax=Hypothenemus hampei TaxID=57062 RepID=A0ABD1EFS3_HYPHA
MPVGISFENSSLKNSFSLSSLQQTPIEDNNTEQHQSIVKRREFNSLTKSKPKAQAVRRSWGSTASDQGEEFWSVLQANYNFIMDTHLIDKCQEVNGDLTEPTGTWTLKEFYAQFSELYSWLNSVQETIYGKEKNIIYKAFRARCANKVLEKTPLLKLFNEQASQLVELHPEVQEEIRWRRTHLNSKWDSILTVLGTSDCSVCSQDTCLDIDNELKCLKNWFKIMETCIQPLNFRAKYTKTEIETKALELNVLHRDIENHGKIVGSVVKLCKRSEVKCNTSNARRIANGLEHRWQLLFLRSLEWQCYLESLTKRNHFKNSGTTSEESESDCCKEPASKYPRLSDNRRYMSSRGNDSNEDNILQYPINDNKLNDTAMSNSVSPEDDDIPDGATGHGSNFTFTESMKKAPNFATYYFKHEDTDSDIDRSISIRKKNVMHALTPDETSEEEWTYAKTIEEMDEGRLPKVNIISEDKIRMLVQKAEELVSPEKCRNSESSLKMSRVNKWLNLDRSDDSCDASAEEDEKESQTSEEINVSTATLKEDDRNNSYVEVNNAWVDTAGLNFFHHSSISESALNKINFSPTTLDRFTTLSANNFTINASASSAIEEVSPLKTEKLTPIRRKKSKLKKKALFGKSDSHLLKSNSNRPRNLLFKSGSFSGYSLKKCSTEKHFTSDPSAVNYCTQAWYYMSTTSGAESEDDSQKRTPPLDSYINLRQTCLNSEIRDESPGKFSLNAIESNSLSEAWDNYQENYLSEPYSESHDSDAARRLLNFGEDYRNFIDSQSDWSALSDISPKFKRKTLSQAQTTEDSPSDDESLKTLINRSKDQLKLCQDVFEHVGDSLGNQIDELIANCDSHLTLLGRITESSEEFKMSVPDTTFTKGLLSQWNMLKMRGLKMQEYRALQKKIQDLKNFISSLEIQEENAIILNCNDQREDLAKEIDTHHRILVAIENQAPKLASLNAVVHRFTLESQDFLDFINRRTLKTEITELYELFENVRTRTSIKLGELENLLPAWRNLEARLEQLKKDLFEDGKTLNLLDTVLCSGRFTDQTATCIRDVAKVLSKSTTYQGYTLHLPVSLPDCPFFTESSFSDSGISDEGSEHEIGERQGRLAAIKRLVRQLEVSLSPDSKIRVIMRENLVLAEEELKLLQQRCRNLIVRTAAVSQPVLGKLSQKDIVKLSAGKKLIKTNGGDDDPEPNDEYLGKSWIKRFFKASLAFQLVILTFVCLSCLYEPQCCDYMNTYHWSVSAKLHYEGRPPI